MFNQLFLLQRLFSLVSFERLQEIQHWSIPKHIVHKKFTSENSTLRYFFCFNFSIRNFCLHIIALAYNGIHRMLSINNRTICFRLFILRFFVCLFHFGCFNHQINMNTKKLVKELKVKSIENYNIVQTNAQYLRI